MVIVKGSAPHNAVNKTNVPIINPLTIKVDFRFLKVTRLINKRIDLEFRSSILLVFSFSWYLVKAFKFVKLKIIKQITPKTPMNGVNEISETITSDVKVTTIIIALMKNVKALVHFIQNSTNKHMITRAKTIAAKENLTII